MSALTCSLISSLTSEQQIQIVVEVMVQARAAGERAATEPHVDVLHHQMAQQRRPVRYIVHELPVQGRGHDVRSLLLVVVQVLGGQVMVLGTAVHRGYERSEGHLDLLSETELRCR